VDIERDNAIPGVPPTSMWSALPLDPGLHTDPPTPSTEAVIALIGLDGAVQKLDRRLTRIGKKQVNLPLVSINIGDESWADAEKIRLSALVLGIWPTVDAASSVVTQIAGPLGDGPRQWEKRIRSLVIKNPDRVVSSGYDVSDDLVRFWAECYLSECHTMLHAGSN